jgi:hypothetical protein
MKAALSLCLVSVSAALAGCSSSMKVTTDFDPEANFTGLGSYAWEVPTAEGERAHMAPNPQSERRIIEAVDRELADKGYRQVSSDPDLLVAFFVAVDDSIDAETVITDYKLGYVSRQPEYYTYREGTLVLFIAEGESRRVIWEGSASETFESPTREEINKAIDKAVHSMLSAFPPKR